MDAPASPDARDFDVSVKPSNTYTEHVATRADERPMTRAAESITIEFAEEDGVWTPTDLEPFHRATDVGWTPRRVCDWFAAESTPPEKGLRRILYSPPVPSMISTALGGAPMRYVVRRGLVFPRWAAFGSLDRESLIGRNAPDGCHFDVDEHVVYLRFDDPEPLSLATPLGLVRCTTSHDGLHWYVDGTNRFRREPERWLPASHGSDGHV